MGAPIAVADITFIDDDNAEERVSFEALQSAGVADKPLAYAAWNTTAAGTALSAASCASLAAYAGLATQHVRETFLFDKYVDDYAYRLLVRPKLNAELRSAGYEAVALGEASGQIEAIVRHDLWQLAVDLFNQNFSAAWRRVSSALTFLGNVLLRCDSKLHFTSTRSVHRITRSPVRSRTKKAGRRWVRKRDTAERFGNP